MKLLNLRLDLESNLPKIKAKQSIKKIENPFTKDVVLYDTNSMLLWKLDKEDKIQQINTLGTESQPYIPGNLEETQDKMIVFQATYACNYKCEYCFVRHHYVTKENKLDYDTAIKALEKFCPNGRQKGYRIGFFGGEPLLNWETVKQISDTVFGWNSKSSLHITSNGSLITEEIAEYCAEHNFSWIISLDGPKYQHDAKRPYAKGGGTFEDTMRGLNFLADAYKKLGKSNPITLRGTYDNTGCDLLECVKFLNSLVEKGLANHVSFEPAFLSESCSTTKTSFERQDLNEVRARWEQEYWKTAEWFLSEIKKGKTPVLHHFSIIMQRVIDRQFAVSECGAGKGYISVGPGGKVSACHRENGTELGTIKDGIDKIKQQKWLDNRFYIREKCPECWMRHLCGGGCRQDSIQSTGNIHLPDKYECLFKDLYIKPALWIVSQLTEDEKTRYSIKRRQQPRQQPKQQPKQQCICSSDKNQSNKSKEGCNFVCQTNCQYACELEKQ